MNLVIISFMMKYNDYPGFLIRRLFQKSVLEFSNKMRDLSIELTPVQYALLYSLRNGECLDQKTLAKLTDCDTVTLSGVVDRLAKKNYLHRRPSETDRRANIISIAPDGLKLIDEIEFHIDHIQNSILKPLSTEEQKIFLQLMKKLLS